MRFQRFLLLCAAAIGTSWSLHASAFLGEPFAQAVGGVPAADAPGAPSGLLATVDGTTVHLSWSPSITGGPPAVYVVQASLTSNGAVIASLPVAGSSVSVPNVPTGTYFVRVRGQNAEGTGPPSNEVQAVVGSGCALPPNPPTSLIANVASDVVSLTWSAPIGGCPHTGYVLRAGTGPGLTNVVTTAVGTVLGLTATAPPGTYYVTVVAVNGAGQSAASNEVPVTVAGVTLPGAPVAFSASANGTTATFSWAPSSGGGAPASYLLEASLTAGGPVVAALPAPSTTLTVSNVPIGTFFVRVRGVNVAGIGPASPEQSISIAPRPVSCVPGTPGAPTASVAGTTVTISWSAVSRATSYRLDVGTTSGASNVLSAELTGTSRDLQGVTAGTYFMRVTAQNECGPGITSGEGTFSIGVPPPTVTSVAVSGPDALVAGQAQPYTATATLSNGASQNVTGSSTWTSSNTAVATVAPSGIVTAVAAGATEIRATHQGMTGVRVVQVTVPAPRADFAWVTDPTTFQYGVVDGQCGIRASGTGTNVIRCRFDAALSTPRPGIDRYVWEIPIKQDLTFEGDLLDNPSTACGDLLIPATATPVPVTLRVFSPGGTHAVTRTVVFLRAGSC